MMSGERQGLVVVLSGTGILWKDLGISFTKAFMSENDSGREINLGAVHISPE
jgi:hypothetical protein